MIVAVLGGGRLAYGALGMVRAARATGASFAVRGWARGESSKKVLHDGGASVAESAAEAVSGAAIVILAVPAPAIASVVNEATSGATGDQVVVHAARGVHTDFALPSQVIRRRSCWKKIAVLGGPLYLDDARETSRSLNAAVASRFDEAIAAVRSLVKGAPIRLSQTHDVTGVELCGALSNVGHLAAGLAAGAGLSETDQGLLHVRALLEAGRLGRMLGAERSTFSGLAGVGDLIPRRVSSQLRHKDLGQRFAASKDGGDDVRSELVHLEGAITAREGAALSARAHVDAPLLRAVAAILDDGAAAGVALSRVLDTELGLQAS